MSLERIIHDEIETRGPLTFDRFMELALYHPEFGYYTRPDARLGWAGHFVTAPELDPAFGELWARGFELLWESCGRPTPWHVVEVGPGEGSFIEALRGALTGRFADVVELHVVEHSTSSVERLQKRLGRIRNLHWYSSIEDVPELGAGCVFANEVVDNLPVRLVERRDGEIRELLVASSGNSFEFQSVIDRDGSLTEFFDQLGVLPPEGHRAEVSLAASHFVRTACTRLDRGAVILVDYGDDAENLLARAGGTLLCYSTAGADDRPLESPGAKDITVHANWTALRLALESGGAEVSGPIRQSDVLRSLGLAEVNEALKARSRAAGAAESVRALSRRGAVAALVDPGGLGGFGVMTASVGCGTPGYATEPAAGAGSLRTR